MEICHFMIGKTVNLYKIISFIRKTIDTFLPLDCSLWLTIICIISDSQQKLLYIIIYILNIPVF